MSKPIPVAIFLTFRDSNYYFADIFSDFRIWSVIYSYFLNRKCTSGILPKFALQKNKIECIQKK